MATPASPAASQPTGLGSAYAKLWTAASVSFVGDGIYSTALPLLAATLTRDPLGVAAVEVAGQLPWLLFALHAGALVDRWDRRRVLWLTDAYRALVLVGLTVAIVAGWVSIPLLGAAGFLLAVGGTLFTPATMSILPGLVSRDPARQNGPTAAWPPPRPWATTSSARRPEARCSRWPARCRSRPMPSPSPPARPCWPASRAATRPPLTPSKTSMERRTAAASEGRSSRAWVG